MKVQAQISCSAKSLSSNPADIMPPLKYQSTTEQLEAIHAAYLRRWPGRTRLRLTQNDDCYVINGPSGATLEISKELVYTMTAEQFVEFINGKQPG